MERHDHSNYKSPPKKKMKKEEEPEEEEETKLYCVFCAHAPCVVEENYDTLMLIGNEMKEEDKSNKEICHRLYKEMARHMYGYLGKKNRKKLPLCVEDTIKRAFPNEKDQEYTGFKEAKPIGD
jgi:hypothetical protein